MMFGLRQVIRASLRCPMKSLERSPGKFENHCKNLLQIVQNDGITRKLTTKLNENSEDEKSLEITKHPVAKINAQMKIMFTCKKCDTRNSKTMSKLAYEKGVVIIRCDGCKNNHLIADNLGWFGADSRKRNIEKIMKLNGEKVKRLTVYGSDVLEVINKNEEIKIESERIENSEIETAEINR